MPRSRLKLAIPFVGKDVPSRASEFAHPDIIIGLTVLAYRYEGLRESDFEQDVVKLLRDNFEKEVGPFHARTSALLYRDWVNAAGGAVLGMSGDTADSVDEDRLVVPLWLLKSSNVEQMTKLFRLIRKLPAAINNHLEQVIFPTFCVHQSIKLSASGQDLGGEALFGLRIGFSGTPSDLLPIDLGQCSYEKGSDGKMLHVLTDEAVVSLEPVLPGWNVDGLLAQIANATPHYSALIDTGALITGFTNEGVARRVLTFPAMAAWCEGVVFLDESDEKMILVKATGRVVSLSQCGISVEKRFAFYDQIHTTGMDIKHAPNARAALTLGKDMVFRDYAQGAFRMRGIGDGQTVSLVVIPEFAQLMTRDLAKAGRTATAASPVAERLKDVASCLVLNAMRSEHMQLNMLAQQDLNGMSRLNAFNHLLIEHQQFTLADQKDYLMRLLADDTLQSATGVGSLPKYNRCALFCRLVSSDQLARSRQRSDRPARPCYPPAPALILQTAGSSLSPRSDPCLSHTHRYTLLLFATAEQVQQGTAGSVGSVSEALSATNLTTAKLAFVVWVPTKRVPQKKMAEILTSLPGWLAVPSGQTLRLHRLREYFALSFSSSSTEQLVILDHDFSVINTRAQNLVYIASRLSRANQVEQTSKQTIDAYQAVVDQYNDQIRQHEVAMEPSKQRLQHQGERLQQLDPRDVAALCEYIEEPTVAAEASAALHAAAKSVQEAKSGFAKLTVDELVYAAEVSVDDVAADLKNAVEAVCMVLGRHGNFASAQLKMMRPTAAAMINRLKSQDPSRLPPNIESKVSAYLSLPPPSSKETVAVALHKWVVANIAHARATQAKADAQLSAQHTASMTATVQLICELNGLSSRTVNTRTALQMAAAFPVEQVESGGTSASILELEERVYRLKGRSDWYSQRTALMAPTRS